MFFLTFEISSIVIKFCCEFITSWDFCVFTGVVFWHTWPGCDPFLHGCGWPFCLGLCILNLLNYLHHWFLQSLFFLLINNTLSFSWFSILKHMFFNYFFFVVTLTSTTFTFEMIVCVSTTGWTSVIITYLLWNFFCISTNFGQFVILCPFKPQMWHAYEDVFYGFWLGCVASMVAIVVFFFFPCLHTVIRRPAICAMFVSLPYIILCFH